MAPRNESDDLPPSLHSRGLLPQRSEPRATPRTPAAAAPESRIVGRRVGDALRVLHDAYEYALDVQTDRWNFAIELEDLLALGLTNSDLRWLLLKGYVETARETTLPGDEKVHLNRLEGPA